MTIALFANPSLDFSEIDQPVLGEDHPLIEERGRYTVIRGESVSFPLADPPVGDRRFAATGLPPGLVIDPTTGAITGAPGIAGEYPVVIEARREHPTDPVAFLRFMLEVKPPEFAQPPRIAFTYAGVAAAFAAVERGPLAEPIGVQLLARSESYSELVPRSLPPGLSFDLETMLVSGQIEETGAFRLTFELRAPMKTLPTIRAEFPLYVYDRAAGSITHQRIGEVDQGTPVELNYVPVNAVAPVTFFAFGLPDGLQLDEATGTITGAFSKPGQFEYLVGFRDANGVLAETYRSSTRVLGRSWPSPPKREAQFREYHNPQDESFPLDFGPELEVEALSLPEGLTYTPGSLQRTGTIAEGLYKARVRLTNETGHAEIDLWLAFFIPADFPRIELNEVFGSLRVGSPYKGIYEGLESATDVTVANLPPGLSFDKESRIVSGVPTQAGNWETRLFATRDGRTMAFRRSDIYVDHEVFGVDGIGQSAALTGSEWYWSVRLSLAPGTVVHDVPDGASYFGNSQFHGLFEKPGRHEITFTDGEGNTTRKPAVIHVYDPPKWGTERRRARILPQASLFDGAKVAVLEHSNPFSSEAELHTSRLSGDGTLWTQTKLPNTPGIRSLVDIAYGDQFILATNLGWSVSGNSRELDQLEDFGDVFLSLAADDELVVASSQAGLWELVEGDWQLFPDADRFKLSGVAIGNGVILGVGNDGVVEVYTKETRSLISRSQPLESDLKDVLFSEGEFIVIGEQGTVMRSVDGLSWIIDREPTPLGADFRHLTVNKDWIIAVAPWTTLAKRRGDDSPWRAVERVPVEGSLVDDLTTVEGDPIGGFSSGLYVPTKTSSSVTVFSSICQSAIIDQPFAYKIGALAGDQCVYRVEGLPEGLTFDPLTGTILGKLIHPGSYEILIETSNGGSTHGKTLTIDAYSGPRRLLVTEINVPIGTDEVVVPTNLGDYTINIENSFEENVSIIPIYLENASGTTFQELTVNVVGPRPVFLSHPNSVVVSEGSPATLRAEVQGRWPITFQWFHDGIAIPNAEGLELLISNVSETEVGLYELRATNALGTTSSNAARLSLPESPSTFSLPDLSNSQRVDRTNEGFQFQFDHDLSFAESAFLLQTSENLTDWTALAPLQQSTEAIANGRQRVTWTFAEPAASTAYVRLSVTIP